MKDNLIRPASEIGAEYFRDESRNTGYADYAAFPADAEEVKEALRFAREKDLAVTIQGGRTGLAAAAVPYGGLILNLSGMNRVTGMTEKNGKYILAVQPGVVLLELRKQISTRKINTSGWDDESKETFIRFSADKEQFFPTDPTETSATIGGMTACNASGARSYKYKAMRKHVEGLRMILCDGRAITIHRGEVLSNGLDASLPCEDGSTLEFRIPSYRMPAVKNASGYFAEPDMDIVDLLVGSDGTLGVIVEIFLYLDPLPDTIWGCACLFKHEQNALVFVDRVREMDSIASIEYFDAGALAILREQKKAGSAFAALQDIPEDVASIVYAELHCESEDIALKKLLQIGDLVTAAGGDENATWVARNQSDLDGLMFFRHAVPESVNMRIDVLRKTDSTLTKLGSDMSVPNDRLFDAVALYRRDIARSGVDSAIWGHIGDNHLHVNFLPKNREEAAHIKELFKEWAVEITRMGGAVSAEHGVGKLKASFLEIMYGPEHIEQMRELKRAFDPDWRLGENNLFSK